MASITFLMNDIVKCDLYIRFSLGSSELVIRGNCKKLFDQLRNAHWYYLDFYCPQPGNKGSNKEQKGIPIAFEDFCEEMIRYIPEWKYLHGKWRQLYDDWRQKTSKAVRCGAIVLDNTFSYVLLVKGFFRDGYQFPAGKKDNDGEPYETCAVREVVEETGFDISKLIRPSLFFERKVLNCLRRYYLITGVHPDTTALRPSSRNEIKVILWMKIDNIPNDTESAKRLNLSPREFFLCMPWVKQLQAFSRHLREGALPFKALQLSEACIEDNVDGQTDNTDKKGNKYQKCGRNKLRDSSSTNNSNSGQSHINHSNDFEMKSKECINPVRKSSFPGNSFQEEKRFKQPQKRRIDKRKNRINNVSTNHYFSDSQVDDGIILSRVVNKDNGRKRSHNNKVKDSHQKNSSSCSDSGFSDHSDQVSVSNGERQKEDYSNDTLMNKAILALKQIPIPTK